MASFESFKPIQIDVENICVAETGTLPQSQDYARNVIFSGEENKVYIRPFNELKITTITNVTLLMGMVMDMTRLYHSLPCMPYNQYTKGKNFTHGVITSVRMEDKYRGEPGGCFPNSLMINIWGSTGKVDASGQQICSKVSAKITQVKIQMCGVASYEMGLEISHEIVKQINETLDLLITIRSKPLEYSSIRQWVSVHGKGHPCNNSHSNLPMKHLVNWENLRSPPAECMELYQSILPHVYDNMFYEDLVNILNYHSSADPGKIADYLQVRKIGLSMTNYNYMLGFKIDRQILYEYLKASKMNVVYNNTKVSYVLVRMASRIPNGDSVIRRVEQNGRQTFMIQESGRIMHSGPETVQMATCYYKLMGMIATIRDQIASSIPSLQEFLSSSQTRRRGRRKKKSESDTLSIYDPHSGMTPMYTSYTPQIESNTNFVMETPTETPIFVPPVFVPNIDKMYNNDMCQIVEDEEEEDNTLSIPNVPIEEFSSLFLTTTTSPNVNSSYVFLED